MKYNIIHTENYLLIVDDSEIKEGDFYLRYNNLVLRCTQLKESFNEGLNKNEIIILSNGCGDPYERSRDYLKKIIAHLPLNDSPILEGVDLLPPLEDDVEKMAINEVGVDGEIYNEYDHEIFIKGYNKAKEKYRFTEEDIAKAITYGWDLSHYHRLNTEEKLLKMQIDFIKTLSKPKMPVAFDADEDYYGGEVKWKINTITNSDGKKVWIGKYIY